MASLVVRSGSRFLVQLNLLSSCGSLVPVTHLTPPGKNDLVENISVRFRTVGDITCTAPVESTAASLDDIVRETEQTRVTERGATRLDDQTSEAAMELRKKEGYF